MIFLEIFGKYGYKLISRWIVLEIFCDFFERIARKVSPGAFEAEKVKWRRFYRDGSFGALEVLRLISKGLGGSWGIVLILMMIIRVIISGTANDAIFMMLPMVDNFWQAQVDTVHICPHCHHFISIIFIIIILIIIIIIGSGDVDTPNATIHPLRVQCLSLS